MSYSYKLKIVQAVSKYLKPNADLGNTLSKIGLPKEDIDANSIYFAFRDLPQTASVDGILSMKNEVVQSVQPFEKGMLFKIDTSKYLEHTLKSDTKCNTYRSLKVPFKVVIDFSSPNIAKPFHFGHLRSTIIGNFISNICEHVGDNVVKLNYLGDWGVQFGLLKYGLDEYKIDVEKLNENPLRVLYDTYVKVNQLMEKEPEIENRSKDIFRRMEFAERDNDELKKWSIIKSYTVDELTKIYNRLGIQFDEYDWESDYSAKRIEHLIDLVIAEGVVIKENDALVAKIDENTSVPFLKSDGTTLYLSRDLAAVLDRHKRYNFDRMLYVVDSSQSKHFRNLITILNKIDPECAAKIEHVRFGRIIGLSTRKGTAVFLDDILNEIREKMELKRIQTFTTKGEFGGEIADILGISALVVNDLRKPRHGNYDFDLDNILKIEGNSGAKLQYCHCRLCSLEEVSGAKLPQECDVSVLKEPEAMRLIIEISKFEDSIIKSYCTLESSIFLQYLFNLCDAINKAHKVLRVKGENDHLASQRLLMFHKARLTLNKGMKLIGIKPLQQM